MENMQRKKDPRTKGRIIMIHEVDKRILDILRKKSNSNDIFTFDDGLYSNYKYIEELTKFPNKKIFFFT